MTKLILEKEFQTLLEKIGKIADQLNIKVFAIGGFVRDLLLHKKCYDIDFVVLGDAIDFAKNIQKQLKTKNFVVYEKFQTASMQYNDFKLEFVSARAEKYKQNSRKPIVQQADLLTDILRRDFTINTLALGLNKNNFCELIDKVGGLQDLNNKIIKTPLDPIETFNDDPLRIMRAIRFAAQLHFSIEEKTYQAILQTTDRLEIVSMERIRDEFFKIMLSDKPSIGLWLLFKTGILKKLFPELNDLYGVEEIKGKKHKNILAHTFQVVDQLAEMSDKLELRLAALFHDIGKLYTKKFLPEKGWTFYNHEYVGSKMIYKISQRMKFSNKMFKYLKKMIRLHMRPIALTNETVTDSAVRRLIVQAEDDLDDLMILAKADITSRNPEKRSKQRKKFDFVLQRIQEVKEKDALRAFQSPVRGDEIMQITGLKPGPEVGRIKKQIEEAILDGIIPNEYNAAKEYLLNVILKEKPTKTN